MTLLWIHIFAVLNAGFQLPPSPVIDRKYDDKAYEPDKDGYCGHLEHEGKAGVLVDDAA